MDRKKVIYIGLLFIITVIVSITYFSYAFFTHRDEQHGKLNIVTGTLDYKISSSVLDNTKSITLAANEKARLNIEITSLNTINSKYELYYTTTNDNIEIGYTTANQQPTGTINAKAKKTVTVIIKNKTANSAKVTFGVEGGFTANTLTISTGNHLTQYQEAYCEVATNTAYDFDYTGDVQEFDTPCSGNYKVEAWGAHGGKDNSYANGAYTKGSIELEEDTTFYIYVGQGNLFIKGGATTPYMAYNGGGISGSQCHAYTEYGGYSMGGGATDIRKVESSWDNQDSLRSRIMVAAGGGGGNGGDATNTGSGGGLIGYDGIHRSTWGTGATQTSGGTLSGSFGIGGTGMNNNDNCNQDGTGGGGAGWYGGGGSESNGSGTWSQAGGGSSYISGHTGCVAVTSKTSSTPKTGCTTGTSDNSCSIDPYGYAFSNTVMIDGNGCKWTNELTNDCSGQPQPDGTTATGHSGNGYARITYLSESTKEEKTAIKYIVTFNANGGSVNPSSKVVAYNSSYGRLPIPKRNGYTFKGWNGINKFNVGIVSDYTAPSAVNMEIQGNDLYGNSLSGNGGYARNEVQTYPSGTYTFHMNSTSLGIVLVFPYDSNGNLLTDSNITIPNFTYNKYWGGWWNGDGRITVTIPNQVSYFKFGFVFSGGGARVHVSELQIEEGNKFTAYEPYYITSSTTVAQNQNHTLTAIWEQN